ncbi:hypothetical protein V8B55DRAFT_1473376 [Mucor lusitanicus]|uniref:Uncharacterized protein n=2 Tax=Mucor circinelloides f. lusitanicus TaxID=29924 RepID=A0A162RNL0_MUCCL|nr:hypothetical protein FB192DRAFT_1446512 [Mucor lusitanicus]OAD07579.1 hypothetical protein MUCCIDRAFT_90329 [Mucor lusitanicus CBS 277.49]
MFRWSVLNLLYKAENCILDDKIDLDQAVSGGTDNGIIKTTETVFFGIDRFVFYLDELYNRFQTFDDVMDMDDAVDSGCLRLPETHTLGPKEIAETIGLASFISLLVNQKKRASVGHQASQAEEVLLGCCLHQSQNVSELDRSFQQHEECRATMRSFYSSNKQCARKSHLELTKQKGQDRLAAKERRAASSKGKTLVMFVGDRGHGVGSPIKGHQRFGGKWKQEAHARYTPTTIITNEYNSSQTCLFCFRKLCHPVSRQDSKVKFCNGSFVGLNDKCPNAFTVVCRDQVSALAIGLAGLASLLFGVTFPCFDERSTQASNLTTRPFLFCH